MLLNSKTGDSTIIDGVKRGSFRLPGWGRAKARVLNLARTLFRATPTGIEALDQVF